MLTPELVNNTGELVEAAMAQLKQDKDRNVREVAGGEKEPETQLINNDIIKQD